MFILQQFPNSIYYFEQFISIVLLDCKREFYVPESCLIEFRCVYAHADSLE